MANIVTWYKKRARGQFLHDQSGTSAVIIAVSFMTLLGATSYAIDATRFSMVRNQAQNALANAAYAAITSENQLKVYGEANNFFSANMPASYMGTKFSDVSVQNFTEAAVTFSVTARVPYVMAQAVGAGTGRDFTLYTTIRRNYIPTEITLALETSEKTMSAYSDVIKKSITYLADAVYGNNDTVPGLTVSLMNFSDAVKYEPNVANQWLINPRGMASDYSGCIANGRANDYDLTETAPMASVKETLFPDYLSNNSETPQPDPAANEIKQDKNAELANLSADYIMTAQQQVIDYSALADVPTKEAPNPDCGLNISSFFIASHKELVSKVAELKGSGNGKKNIGVAHAWYSLSPNWRGIIEPTNADNPRDYSSQSKKIMILFSSELGGVTKGEYSKFYDICTGMKKMGIEIYVVQLDATGGESSKSLLSTCATDSAHVFAADGDLSSMQKQMAIIGSKTITYRIIK